MEKGVSVPLTGHCNVASSKLFHILSAGSDALPLTLVHGFHRAYLYKVSTKAIFHHVVFLARLDASFFVVPRNCFRPWWYLNCNIVIN